MNLKMKKRLKLFTIFFSASLLIFSCKKEEKPKKVEGKDNKNELVDSVTDSIQIGNHGNSKLELLKYQTGAAAFILVKMAQRENNHWKQVYQDTLNSNGLSEMAIEIRDYNSDGFKDLKVRTRIGANLANAIYTVLLYSDATKKLSKVGSGWNLEYSDTLKMFRSRYVASTLYADYYTIQDNKLSKVFEVNLTGTSESVTEFDKKGKPIKTIETHMDTVNYTLPKVKHWLREITIADSLN